MSQSPSSSALALKVISGASIGVLVAGVLYRYFTRENQSSSVPVESAYQANAHSTQSTTTLPTNSTTSTSSTTASNGVFVNELLPCDEAPTLTSTYSSPDLDEEGKPRKIWLIVHHGCGLPPGFVIPYLESKGFECAEAKVRANGGRYPHVDFDHPRFARSTSRYSPENTQFLPIGFEQHLATTFESDRTLYNSEEFIDPALPPLSTFAGVIVLGGAMGAYDTADFPFLVREKAFMRQVIRSDIPLLGICLGSQLLADCLGGCAIASPNRPELGVVTFSMGANVPRDTLLSRFALPVPNSATFGHLSSKTTPAMKTSEVIVNGTPLLPSPAPTSTSSQQSLEEVLHVRKFICIHGDMFFAPKGTDVILWTNSIDGQAPPFAETYPHALRARSALGVQFHPEANPEQFRIWIENALNNPNCKYFRHYGEEKLRAKLAYVQQHAQELLQSSNLFFDAWIEDVARREEVLAAVHAEEDAILQLQKQIYESEKQDAEKKSREKQQEVEVSSSVPSITDSPASSVDLIPSPLVNEEDSSDVRKPVLVQA